MAFHFPPRFLNIQYAILGTVGLKFPRASSIGLSFLRSLVVTGNASIPPSAFSIILFEPFNAPESLFISSLYVSFSSVDVPKKTSYLLQADFKAALNRNKIWSVLSRVLVFSK